jgi:TonB family protein
VRAAAAVAVSLALNALLVWLLLRVGAFDTPRPPRETRVSLAPLTAGQWAANRAIGGAAPRARPPSSTVPVSPPPPAPPQEERPRRQPGQIVDVAPSKDNRPPKDSRYLSDRDNTVDKETRSRFAGTRAYENTLPMPSEGAKKPPRPAEQKGEGGQAAEAKAGKEGPKGGTAAERPEMPKQPAQERLALAPHPDEPGTGEPRLAPREDRQRVPGTGESLQVPGPPGAPDGGGQRRSGPLDARLLPDPQSLARIAGGPSPNRLQDVTEGDATALNTRSFKYATFINRVGLSVYREWDPNRAYLSRDPNGTVFPQRDRTTGIQLVLAPDGGLRFVKVFEASGLDFLDNEIVRAVRAAAPFPNPPNGLVENGEIHLTFYYTLESRHASRVQVVLPPSAGQRPYPE